LVNLSRRRPLGGKKAEQLDAGVSDLAKRLRFGLRLDV
jgi:hypothetical protein